MSNWDRFITQFRKDLKQWLFFMLTLSFFRVVFVLYFRGGIEKTSSLSDVLESLLNGLRYDGMVATYFILLPLLLCVFCGFADLSALSERLRRLFGILFSVLSTILFIVTIAYFKEYNDQFNHFVFNLYYDDTRAIFTTIWAEYHVIPNLIIIALTSFFLVRLYLWFMSSGLFEKKIMPRALPVPVRIVIGLATAVLIVIGLRGSFGHRPLKLEDAAVIRDSFLSKAVLNPYSALLYAYRAHQKVAYVMTGLETYLPDRDVRKAAQEVFNTSASYNSLDEYLRKVAPGHRNIQPKHIFLVVMESYDAWPLMRKYSSLGLTPELSALGRKGRHIVDFLPASDGTATSLSALITGLPDANVVTNYQKSSQTAFPSSIAESFKRLGYRTRFFYGGYLSWQKIGDFAKAQGFEEVYGAAHIGSWASHNEWGVEDETLFDFIVKTVGSAASQPSINLIMTTSYHPPYELDVYGKGFSLRKVPDELAAEFDNSVTLKMLGHLWYSDRCIGDFVRSAEKKLAPALFAFTGDHYGRKFINNHPDFFEASAVPFILYGRDVLRNIAVPANAAGGHIDIAPTLIELSAPKGFTYSALGRNILSSGQRPLGFGRGKLVSADFIFDGNAGKFHPLPDTPLPKTLPDPGELKRISDNMNGIAWWRIMRGAKLD